MSVHLKAHTRPFYPEHGPPAASFGADPEAGPAPLAVAFSDRSTGDPEISAWLWDFGDGAGSSAQNPSHTYAAAGDYLASLTVTNRRGSSTASRTIHVSP